MRYKSLIALLFISMLKLSAQHTAPAFSYLDVYELEYASDPQIAPYGDYIVYRRMGFDILKDQSIGNLWLLKTDGSIHQKLTNREVSESSPIWSPKGDRIAFISPTDQGSEIYLYWVDSGKLARISRLEGSPSSITCLRRNKACIYYENSTGSSSYCKNASKTKRSAMGRCSPNYG